MTIMENETPSTEQMPSREEVKRDLVEAYARKLESDAEVNRLLRLSEHPDVGIAVRELAATLNADPRIPNAPYSTWGRRRGAAAGRRQARRID